MFLHELIAEVRADLRAAELRLHESNRAYVLARAAFEFDAGSLHLGCSDRDFFAPAVHQRDASERTCHLAFVALTYDRERLALLEKTLSELEARK